MFGYNTQSDRGELPTLPGSVPTAIRWACYAARQAPRGYSKAIPLIAKLSSALWDVIVDTHSIVGDFRVDLRESACAEIFARGRYTNQRAQDLVFSELLQPGMIAFDIGANIGYYSKFFSRKVGPNGIVVAVEPMPRALSILWRNCGDNISVLDAAIGASAGFATLHEKRDLVLSFVEFSSSAASGATKVVTIDNLADKYGIPDLVKIDVEGAERAALIGAVRTLAATHRPIWIFEYIAENACTFGGYKLDDLLRLFDRNYEIFRIVFPGRLLALGKSSPNQETNDYLAVPQSKLSEIQRLLASK